MDLNHVFLDKNLENVEDNIKKPDFELENEPKVKVEVEDESKDLDWFKTVKDFVKIEPEIDNVEPKSELLSEDYDKPKTVKDAIKMEPEMDNLEPKSELLSEEYDIAFKIETEVREVSASYNQPGTFKSSSKLLGTCFRNNDTKRMKRQYPNAKCTKFIMSEPAHVDAILNQAVDTMLSEATAEDDNFEAPHPKKVVLTAAAKLEAAARTKKPAGPLLRDALSADPVGEVPLAVSTTDARAVPTADATLSAYVPAAAIVASNGDLPLLSQDSFVNQARAKLQKISVLINICNTEERLIKAAEENLRQQEVQEASVRKSMKEKAVRRVKLLEELGELDKSIDYLRSQVDDQRRDEIIGYIKDRDIKLKQTVDELRELRFV